MHTNTSKLCLKLLSNPMKCLYFFSRSNTRFPFDSNNPTGYLIAVLIEYVIVTYEYIMITCTLGLAIGAFWFIISVTKEIQHILHSINDKAQANEDQSNEMQILFAEYIDAHAALKQLSLLSLVNKSKSDTFLLQFRNYCFQSDI